MFRKAASANNAFKPRAGGAGEKFLALAQAAKEKANNEPDGVTAVVPAPLLRGISTDTARGGTPEPKSPIASQQSQDLPKLELSRAATDNLQPQAPLTPVDGPGSLVPEESRSKTPTSKADRRKKRQSQHAAKYANALGIDPILLEGRGGDFVDILDEFGWIGDAGHEKSLEDLSSEIHREMGRAEAGGWLYHVEQQDDRVDQVARLFDRTIEECEEMDGLLTLYGHELSVSPGPPYRVFQWH